MNDGKEQVELLIRWILQAVNVIFLNTRTLLIIINNVDCDQLPVSWHAQLSMLSKD